MQFMMPGETRRGRLMDWTIVTKLSLKLILNVHQHNLRRQFPLNASHQSGQIPVGLPAS